MKKKNVNKRNSKSRRRPSRRMTSARPQSERMLETLLSNLPGLVYRCRNDEQWTMEFASEGCLALTGYPASDFIGNAARAYGDIIHPDDRARVWREVQAAISAGQAFQLVYRIRTGENEERWVCEQGRAIGGPDGSPLYLEGFITDVTQRKRAEDELRASEERFRHLTELSSDWYWEQDSNFRFTRVSGSVYEALGIHASDFIGRRIREFGAAPVSDDRSWSRHKALLDARKAFIDFVFKIINAQGELRYISADGQPMFDEHGEYHGYRGTAKDVTQATRADQLLRLEHSVTRCLADADSAVAALQMILRDICQTEMWDLGQYWDVDEAAGVLRFGQSWSAPDAPHKNFIEHMRVAAYARDEGLPGRVWQTGQPLWVPDIRDDPRLLYPDTVRDAGWRGAFLFPIAVEGKTTGVLYFTSRDIREPDTRLLQTMRVVGSQISQFLKRKRAEEVLRESEHRLTTLLSNLPGMVYRFRNDQGWTVEFMSDGAVELTGRPPSDFVNRSVREYGEMIHPDDRQRIWDEIQEAITQRRQFQFEYRLRTASGQQKWVWEQGRALSGSAENILRFEGFVTDITERVHAEAEMRKLSSAVQQTADCVLITNRDGVIEYVNAAFETTTGYSRDEALGRKPNLVKSGLHDAPFYEQMWRVILDGQTYSDVFVNRKKNGELYYEEKTITPLRDDDGQVTHFVSTGKDITERMHAQERLQYLAHHDALTGLPNRVLFLDRLNHTLNRAHRHGRVVAIMFLDLDRFKYINDTLGHDVGDALLKAIAVRLRTCVREGDTVARFGGDEFAVLLEDVGQAQNVSAIADKVISAFTQPFVIESQELFVTPSIGISLFPTDGTTGAALLKNADAAMYRAKDAGKNNYQFYSVDMTAAAFERFTLETSLRHALAREEFALHYQPQIDLATGRIIGVEALVRWQHPTFGLLTPAHFITVAEETGAIVPVGEWVMRSAALQMMRWRRAGLDQLRISVNVSARQLNEPTFTERLTQMLEETALPPEALELEITESVIMKHPDQTIERLRELNARGVHFAVDDFGTGYSSLSYLRRFPIHTLKIDKSFIQDITEDSGDAEIVKTIIAMARGLKLAVVAEGIETREQLMFLQIHGCHAGQGYLISRPLSADRMTERLTRSDMRSWIESA
jgi:diguanylate cyclase (GGDEF)-like protein/PAS domain S-box-containing protein